LKKKFTNQFQTYLLLTFIIYIFSDFMFTYHKPNGGIDVFKMKDEKLSNLFFCVFENYHFLNGILGIRTFWSNLPCLDPPYEDFVKYNHKQNMK